MDIHHHRFTLITAGHHFLLDVLPFRQPQSVAALETFISTARTTPIPVADLEAVLLRCLNVLSTYTARVPTLVERYLSHYSAADCLEGFKACVEQAIRYEGIADGSVQEAIRIIHEQYSSVECTPRYVANRLGVRLASLDVKFRRFTGSTLTGRIRAVRLNAAAVLLATSDKAIKEIWVDVGYNHHSNFDHDFKREFLISPKAYRRLSLRPAAQDFFRQRSPVLRPPESTSEKAHVLIVDDDEGTRITIGTWLHSQGHAVSTAATGKAALKVVTDVSPNAMLIDYHLYDTDGVTLIRDIRQAMGSHDAGIALFTADWDLLDRATEVAELNAVIASKLCDLEQINDLVEYLRVNADAGASIDATRPPRLPLV